MRLGLWRRGCLPRTAGSVVAAAAVQLCTVLRVERVAGHFANSVLLVAD